MNERIFKLTADHPAVNHTCHRCNKPIGSGIECYLEPEAPASAADAILMAAGRAYTALARLTHVECSPRAVKPIPELLAQPSFEPF